MEPHWHTSPDHVHERLARRLGATVLAVTLWVAAVPTASTAAVPGSLRRYPYLTDLVTTNVTVNWATTTSVATGSMTYGKVGSEACTARAVTAARTSITVGSTLEYQWKALVSGLEPDTPYCYRVLGGTTDLLGTDPSPSFRSQVPPGSTTPYSFAVFGDWGEVASDGTNPDQARLMSQIAASGARFAVTTGDNDNGSGSQTAYGDLVQTGSATSTIFGPAFWKVPGSSIPLFATQGNHGLSSVPLTNWPQDRAVASSDGRYQMDTYCCANGTSSKSYPSMWYAFDAGPARFYVLEATWSNSNVGSTDLYDNDYDAHWLPSSREYTWLAADLASHPASMKFAFFHFPLYSANATEVSDTYLSGANRLEGLLAANGVDIVFNGHAHIYDRNRPSATGMPVTYVTGGGGARLEPVSRCTNVAYALGWSYSSSTHGSSCGAAPRPATIDRVFHFLLVSVNGSHVTVTPIDALGRPFDVQSYTFGGSSGGGPLVFTPTDDTYVRADAIGSNVGTSTTLQTDGDPLKDMLLRFTVSGVGTHAIVSATLRLYCVDPATAGGTFRPTTTSTWTEGTVTWATAPETMSSPAVSLGAVTAGTWVTVDVKTFVTGDGIVSFRVSSTSSNGADYTSSEGATGLAPQLIVTTG